MVRPEMELPPPPGSSGPTCYILSQLISWGSDYLYPDFCLLTLSYLQPGLRIIFSLFP